MLRRVRYSWEHQLFIMDPASILQIITNSTWMVTKLVGSDPVEFQRPEYFAEVPENTTRDLLLRLSARVQSPGDSPVFVITEGNEGGHFWLHPTTGRLSLRAPLDYETKQEHELVVEARAGEARSQARVVVRVVDQNDHAPVFPRALHETQITEEDDRHLPKTILTLLRWKDIAPRLEFKGAREDIGRMLTLKDVMNKCDSIPF
ncbi:putative neural-cadherin 2 [Procambarus clarkii]|uniref:putative neural-cadherin 2 n=1 Tax=Procambarus clarkii TaxID=6728 RepID=UPI003742A8EE